LILVELLTITQWVEVRGDLWWYWWNCWPSLNELKWEVIFVDSQQFHQYQQKSPLTSTHWVMNNNSTNIKSPLTLTHWDHHSMSWSERWFLLILVELLTITQWVEVRGDFCWYWWNCWPSLNELRCHQYQQTSPLTLAHWVMSTIPPISIKITSHLNSLSDGQQFHQYQQKSPLTLTHSVMVSN
jgi:hypothetical protein